MSAAKITVAIDGTLLRRLDKLVKAGAFSIRSQAMQAAIREKVGRMDKSRLARECAKLDRQFEESLADESSPEIEAAWTQEALARCRAFDQGKLKERGAEEVNRDWRKVAQKRSKATKKGRTTLRARSIVGNNPR